MYDGSKEVHIKTSVLKDLRSRVVTHEGQTLTGKEARQYMDKHSAKCLGKDLAGSYNNTDVGGYVK